MMKRRDAGFAEKLLPVLLSTGMVFGLVLLTGQFMEIFRARETVNQIARAYMLVMETTGYLQEQDRKKLTDALEQAGVCEVKLTGTTSVQADYGEEIQLVIDGKLQVKLNAAIPFLYQGKKLWSLPVKMTLYSTAKH